MSVLIKGKNDLQTWCLLLGKEDILAEWDYAYNGVGPDCVSRASNKLYIWKCSKCGYRWKANANSRTRKNGTGCPRCSGKIPTPGVNDLKTVFPEVAKQWSSRNEMGPENYTIHSSRKVWWKGSCGHEWKDSISHRTTRGSSCPICFNQIRTSFPEQAIYYYVRQYYPDAVNGDKSVLDGKELDIYIPSRKIAIEYDGQAWHENIEKDEEKNKLCEERGICLYRIRERQCWFWQENKNLKLIACEANNRKELQEAISMLLFYMSDNVFKEYDIDIQRDEIDIRNVFVKKKEKMSLATLFPEIAAEWHPTKNRGIVPSMVLPQSRMRAWWRGRCGHEWQALVFSRTRETQSGCPYCSHPARKLLKGYNDFKTKCPECAEEWDYSKNQVLPDEILSGNKQKVWWICNTCGMSYLASPSNRSNGTGCPKCGHVKTNQAKFVCVENIDTGEVFSSVKEACEKYGLKPGNITKCCKGERKTTGGFRWKYPDSLD